MDRDHFRLVHHTSEVPDADELAKFEHACEILKDHKPIIRDANKSWYKFRRDEIRVRIQTAGKIRSVPLATRSPIVKGLRTVNQRRLYVPRDARVAATHDLNKSGF